MDQPLTFVAIEVPRRFSLGQQGEVLGGGMWTIEGQNLLERAVQLALELADPTHIRLLAGEPDQGVFDMVEQYGVLETDLGTWMQGATEAARAAEGKDVAVFLRASVLLHKRANAALHKAMRAVREITEIVACEPAFRTKRYANNIDHLAVLTETREMQAWRDFSGFVSQDYGYVCPAFEVLKLKNFSRSGQPMDLDQGKAFVWVEEEDVVTFDGPFDLLRAKRLLRDESSTDA